MKKVNRLLFSLILASSSSTTTAKADAPFTLPFGSSPPSSGADYVYYMANWAASTIKTLAYPVAFIGIIYTAYILISSGGKPEAVGTAKKNLGYILTGIFIISFTYTIFNIIRGFILAI